MFETIAVLLIFFILIAFGLIFYSKTQRDNIQNTGNEYFNLKAIQTAQLVSFLPELQCTSPTSANIIGDDCFDAFKIIALKDIIENNQKIKNYYFDIFGPSKITVEQIYPTGKKWVIYNNSLGKSSKSLLQIPVLIYNASSRENYFGVLNINVYN